MKKRIFITGFGIVSGIGYGEEETLDSLLNEKSGIGEITLFETALNRYPVSEVKFTNNELIKIAGLPSEKIYSRTFLLGLITAQQAVRMAGYTHMPKTGLISANTVGGMDLNEQYYISLTSGERTNKDIIPALETAHSTEQIAEHFGIKSNITTISTACSSSANSIMNGARMIQNGIFDCMLVGGVDSLSKFSLNGFNSLEILSPTGCRPFDKERNGVTLGEGAAFLVLESEETAKGKTIYGEITGYANLNEAFHQTSSSPDGEGAKATILQALKKAALQPADIDYINAHGTGTEVNDLSESNAILSVFKEKAPYVSSTKGYTGHTLAAAGAIEAVISLLSLKHQVLFPNLRMREPMSELSFVPIKEIKRTVVHHILSNSFGFGGANTTLIISKV